jgi:hypothetical protein
MIKHRESEEYGRFDDGGVDVIRRERVISDLDRGQALSLLATAASSRAADPEREQRRIELLAAALSAAREASEAMHVWVAQLLSEYRGSRTAWDLQATSERLENTLCYFDATVRDTAALLRAQLADIE